MGCFDQRHNCTPAHLAIQIPAYSQLVLRCVLVTIYRAMMLRSHNSTRSSSTSQVDRPLNHLQLSILGKAPCIALQVRLLQTR